MEESLHTRDVFLAIGGYVGLDILLPASHSTRHHLHPAGALDTNALKEGQPLWQKSDIRQAGEQEAKGAAVLNGLIGALAAEGQHLQKCQYSQAVCLSIYIQGEQRRQ